MSDEIRTYSDLQKEYQHALREQHPEWIEPDGECPTCDDYQRRLAGLLTAFWPERERPAQSTDDSNEQSHAS
jgi:hypothetical protein